MAYLLIFVQRGDLISGPSNILSEKGIDSIIRFAYTVLIE